MLNDHIRQIIENEILQDSDFINIDSTDIEHFIKDINKIEVKSFECTVDEISNNFNQSLLDIQNNNIGYKLSKLLFLIKLSDLRAISLEDLSFIEKMKDDYSDNIECIWGMSVDNLMSSKVVKLIVLYGLIN